MASTWDQLKRTANDLTTLEINTIVKDEMNCRKMVDNDRQALYQLASKYGLRLNELGNKYLEALSPQKFAATGESYDAVVAEFKASKRFRGPMDFEGGGYFSFLEISIKADFANRWVDKYTPYLTLDAETIKKDSNTLSRIGSKSDEICSLFQLHLKEKSLKKTGRGDAVSQETWKRRYDALYNVLKEWSTRRLENRKTGKGPKLERNTLMGKRDFKLSLWMPYYKQIVDGSQDLKLFFAEQEKFEFLDGPDFYFDARDKLAIKKALDLGLEHVVMQTRIGLDGDVTTRISEKFSNNPKDFILNLHNDGVDISVKYWSKIFDTLAGIGKNIIKLIFPT